MARKNRVVVPGGTYHVTSRLAERARWLEDPRLKDEIVRWLHDIAEFSGVELLAWCIMDNHFHILVHVPEVPEESRIVPSEEPAAYAFGMRPAECNPPLWPSAGDGSRALAGTANGDSPRSAALPPAHSRSTTVQRDFVRIIISFRDVAWPESASYRRGDSAAARGLAALPWRQLAERAGRAFY